LKAKKKILGDTFSPDDSYLATMGIYVATICPDYDILIYLSSHFWNCT
jgi:hypothetical protein